MGALGPYNETVMEHFSNPRNMGELDGANAVGDVGNPACGDMMRLYLKIEDGKIADAKFKTFGCGAAIASSSMLTEIIKGMTIEEAKKVTNEQVNEQLGGLPPVKIHCSLMAEEALKAAFENYEKEAAKKAS
ncbi:MAG: Fe-S cluster assembly scaffold protein NifU [candidate division Zixibacteria bacterium]|nr:Fe-S cluster assembly scaffold protein NifU [candidate division Zixibacteria bacterium]